MLINKWSAVMFSMALVSVVLIAYICIAALFTRTKEKRGREADYRQEYIHKKISFVFLTAMILMIIRILSYPLFYAAIQSFVKYMDSAMCMYGVFNSIDGALIYIGAVKPLAFFFAGGWMIFYFLTRHSKNRTLINNKMTFLFFAVAAVLTDSLGDLFLFLNINPGADVTCCTANIDVPGRMSHILSVYLFGSGYEKLLWVAYYLGNITVFATVLYLAGRKTSLFQTKKTLVYVFCMGVINFFISWLAFTELISPELMALPYHHCLYCLVQYVPDAGLIIGLLFLGSLGPAWALGLGMIGTDKKTTGTLDVYLNRLYLFTATCLCLSLLMVSIHILLGSLKN